MGLLHFITKYIILIIMSLMTFETISCPACKRKQEVEVWASLNVTVDPSLRARLFAGEINIFSCVCGYEAEFVATLLYHDMARKIAIHLYPTGVQIDTNGMDPSTWLELPEYLRHPKIVSSLEEMCELIELLEKSN